MRPITLKGAFSSPYTLKMRAVLRYRRIPYRWVLRGSEWDDLPEASVPVIPVIGFHADDGSVEDAVNLGQNAGGEWEIADSEIAIQPGEQITVAAQAVTGTATYTKYALKTREDQ